MKINRARFVLYKDRLENGKSRCKATPAFKTV